MSELDIYRERMLKPTSKRDIKYMLNDEVKIVTYSELLGYENIEDLLSPYNKTVILYPNRSDPNIGHWTTIFKMKGDDERLFWFDSYGSPIENKTVQYNMEAKQEGKEEEKIEPRLLNLILDSKYGDTLYWNDKRFQAKKVGNLIPQTCGLWVVVRLLNDNLDEKEFEELYYTKPVNQKILPDLLVSTVICELYPAMK